MTETDNPSEDFASFLSRAIIVGWVCALLSTFFLFLSIESFTGAESSNWSAIALMTARLFGIVSFFVGAFAVFNKRWTSGVLLFLLSIGLPLVAFHFHGSF